MKPAIDLIPEHLHPYVAHQDPSLYTAIDHASWRFILKISQAFFSENAHPKYLNGLEETGISIDRIPLITEMDEKLKRFGWRAVPVSGFIPPAVFMEFQSLGILPIACEMRTLDHLAYTPAPDIVHEAAGHAPILADPEYAAYLRDYGEVARKAIFSKQDMMLFEAIRALSDIKEDPSSTESDIIVAQTHLDKVVASTTYMSEATYLARMNWWTVEYGLVGSVENAKIFGAGLLSSVGESYHCLSGDVRRIPFTLDCINTSYDITRPQPQLFVTRDFKELAQVLEEFADTMAFRRGGEVGLAKACTAASVTTVELDSGLQASGVVTEFKVDDHGSPIFFKLSGPCQLAHQDRELPKQSVREHQEGFSSPIGKIRGPGKCTADLTDADLKQLGFISTQQGQMTFESGIVLSGVLIQATVKNGKNILLSFDSCTVTQPAGAGGSEAQIILYQPGWGRFDLACGSRVVSVFGGAADRAAYLAGLGGESKRPMKPKTNLTEKNRALNDLYARLRKTRDEAALKNRDASGKQVESLASECKQIHGQLEKNFKADWLLRMELLELNHKYGLGAPWVDQVRSTLVHISANAQDKAEMISRGLQVLGMAQ